MTGRTTRTGTRGCDAKDIATGIPDSDNGVFEVTGLAKQYDQYAELERHVEWKYGTLSAGGTSTASIPWR